ncbi:hypothetical protein [Flammeovirga kamogawensis]|uniref:Uncharacterized protein n=1 Tax=Flammeovirga kamogawensis TaxID=373891 RepID=A0ABX8GXD9_9BACT|nr:hypothetical protein [Flammeovirga kamogawensis]MBB6460931.1 hypothetical protein [Flammeovirga kamogawensis]QWG08274.1 hypothetical protein KM029_04875 [Flammeovirga kamogawensis]TRX70076.1 hypothetical protein EO216_18810 [Flammeovirga kamogawensis]
MYKLTGSAILMCFMSIFCNAQQKIGFAFDAGGTPIHGYYDPMSFTPSVSISKSLESNIPGILYGNNAIVKHRLVKFENAKLSVKTKEGYFTSIPTDTYKGVKIGLDSFFVAQNIHFRGRTRDRKTYVQFIAEFDSTVFAKIYNMNFNGSVLHQTYIAKRYDEDLWEELNPTKKSLEPMIQKFFSKYSNVITSSGELDTKGVNYFSFLVGEYEDNYKMNDKNLGGLINLAYVTSRLGNNEKVYFDKFYRKTTNPAEYQYYSLITSINENNYVEEYFTLEHQKVYSVGLSSKVNGEKEGTTTLFVDGKKVMNNVYEEGEAKSGEVYVGDSLFYSFNYVERQLTAYDEKIVCEYDFSKKQILHLDKTVEDPYDGNTKNIVVKSRLITQSTFKKGDIEYSYLVDVLTPVKTKKINKLFDKHFEDDFFINNAVYQPLLVKMFTDDKGEIINYEFLNAVNENFDEEVDTFIKAYILNGGEKGKFKFKLKNKLIEKPSVFVMPFQLNIKGQYWFFGNNNSFMMQQNLMHQQHMQMMHQQNMNHIHSMAPTF